VVGQRLVLNLRGLKTRTYATHGHHDVSREVDRQLAEFCGAEMALNEMSDLEYAREARE